MKTKIKILFGTALMMVVLASCGSSRHAIEAPQYGFGEEASIEQSTGIDQKISPAANRSHNVAEDKDVPTETGAIATTTSKDESANEDSNVKSSRKHAKLGSKKRKQIKDTIRAYKENKNRGGGSLPLILLIILAIFIPPLAVGLYEGITGRFWLVLILWLLAWGLGGWFFGPHIGALFSLLAIILALLIVLGVW